MSEPTDSTLEERLRDYGLVLDRHIEEAPPGHLRTENRPVAVRTMIAVAAAIGLLVVGGSLIVAALNRTEVTTTGPTDRTDTQAGTIEPTTSGQAPGPSTEPVAPADVEPPPDPESFIGVDRCANTFGSMADDSGGLATPDLFDPRTEAEQIVVLALPDSPSAVEVVVIGPGGFYSCTTSRAGSSVLGLSAGHGDPLAPVAPDQVLLISQSWESATDAGTSGPGSIRTVGRVGADIAAVWVVLADGTTLPGLIDGRWFTVDGDIPRDVPLFDERYFWRLTDGTIESAIADQLDEVSPAEQCAATEGCIERRLIELQQTAATEGLEQQAAALADGWIAPDEQRAAVQATVECLNEAGFNAEVSQDGLGIVSMSGLDEPSATLESQAQCGRLHNDLISELKTLLDARSRPYSADELLAGVDLVVQDPDEVVRNATFFLGVDRTSLEAEVDPAAENPPMLVSFSLAVCERPPRAAISYDSTTQAISVEVVPHEDSGCEANPRPATVMIHFEPGTEIQIVETKVG